MRTLLKTAILAFYCMAMAIPIGLTYLTITATILLNAEWIACVGIIFAFTQIYLINSIAWRIAEKGL